MAIEAHISKNKRTNFKIYIAVCVLFAAVFAYDGYLSKYEWSHRQSFYQKHAKDGQPDDTMMFNRWAPFFLVAVAIVLAGRLLSLRGKKIIADQSELILGDKERVCYDSIDKIDKTDFESKGFFLITYRDGNGVEVTRKLSSKEYDNLQVILDRLVAKIA